MNGLIEQSGTLTADSGSAKQINVPLLVAYDNTNYKIVSGGYSEDNFDYPPTISTNASYPKTNSSFYVIFRNRLAADRLDWITKNY